MVSTASIVQKLGNTVEWPGPKISSCWHTLLMAAVYRPIAERISLVDFVLGVRDARIRKTPAHTHAQKDVCEFFYSLKVFDKMPD